MTEVWQHQLRISLSDPAGDLGVLRGILGKHDARMVSQFEAFSNYVADAEREGVEKFPLYKWTKATLDDPAKCAKHRGRFALHVAGQEVYDRETADAVEADLRPLVGGVVSGLSRHDTNPAANLPVPAEYR